MNCKLCTVRNYFTEDQLENIQHCENCKVFIHPCQNKKCLSHDFPNYCEIFSKKIKIEKYEFINQVHTLCIDCFNNAHKCLICQKYCVKYRNCSNIKCQNIICSFCADHCLYLLYSIKSCKGCDESFYNQQGILLCIVCNTLDNIVTNKVAISLKNTKIISTECLNCYHQ